MTVKVGDRLPTATLRVATPEGAKPVTTDDYFRGRRVALFGLPGAFTPTCHGTHVPGYLLNEGKLKAKGVEAIAMTTVNDPFVVDAWAKATGAMGRIDFLADGNAEFAKAIGMDYDASAGGMGVRSKRYSMLVEDGVVKIINIEVERGKAELSGAAHLLGQLG